MRAGRGCAFWAGALRKLLRGAAASRTGFASSRLMDRLILPFSLPMTDLYILTLGKVLTDVADIGVGDFGNMYHSGFALRQGDECTEIGDGFDFTF